MWHEEQQFVVNQLPEQTNWWNQGFRKFEDPGPNSVPHWGFDDVGNYDWENSSILRDEVGPSMQPLHVKAQPPANEAVHSPQSDDVIPLCDGFINLLKDVDKPLYIRCKTYT